jgi:quercetin dioxygenase-like cupin family protein
MDYSFMTTPAASTASFFRWSDVPSEQVKPDISRRLITGERIMLAQVDLQRGCIVPQHAHVHEQMTYVLEGCLRLTVGSDGETTHDLRAGEVIHLPSSVPHAAVALEDTRVLDVFSPPREDWLNRTDDYLRR